MQTKKNDEVSGFQLPIHKQQLNLEPSPRPVTRYQHKQHHRRPRRGKGDGSKVRGPKQQQRRSRNRVDVSVKYSGLPDGSLTVRVFETDRFPMSMEELGQRGGSARFVFQSGMWFIAITTDDTLYKAGHTALHAEEAVRQTSDTATTSSAIHARVASVDPGIACFATVYELCTGNVYSVGYVRTCFCRLDPVVRASILETSLCKNSPQHYSGHPLTPLRGSGTPAHH